MPAAKEFGDPVVKIKKVYKDRLQPEDVVQAPQDAPVPEPAPATVFEIETFAYLKLNNKLHVLAKAGFTTLTKV